MDIDDYLALDGLGLAAAVAAGDVTAAELLTLAQRRADAVNPQLNAIVRRMDDIAAARVGEDLTGPFAGVPFLLKDLHQEYAGLPSTSGCRPLASVRAEHHATVVQRWLDAGLVVFGRTNTPEFGAKAVTESALWGPARNPWNTAHTPGGSSGGAAAAVAAGIVPVAGASDGGGSIRIPAACCGLFGLKAGRGLIPTGPVTGEFLQGLATDGVVSRTVRDSAAMLDVLAGPEPDSSFLPAVPVDSFASEVGRDPGRLRIGMQTSSSLTPNPHPESLKAVESAATLLEELGHEVEPVAPFYDDAAMARDFLTIWFAAVAWQIDDVCRRTGASRHGFEFDTRIMDALGRAVSGAGVVEAFESRHVYTHALASFHQRYDLLLTPSLARPPLRVGELDTPPSLQRAGELLLRTRTAHFLRHTSLVEDMIDGNLGWVPFTQLANLTGRPAASVPLHWTADGLPLGVQLVAALGGEGVLLRVAAQLEQARPWAGRRPALATSSRPLSRSGS
ncbi:MAG: amidase [Solirubrobacteraceae bacterium]|nr:amidase [Solirubrobacteraceae bacterium]